MAIKTKLIFTCQACGSTNNKWVGQCPGCAAWNTLVEEVSVRSQKTGGYSGQLASKVIPLNEVRFEAALRQSTGIQELDRVLGGGLVDGSVVLLGGDPGIGKSTLLLSAMGALAEAQKVLYVTGEESLQQVSLRANRMGVEGESIFLASNTQVEQIIALAKKERPKVMVIDSIQTLYSEQVGSAPGSVSQVRESAAQLVTFAKQHDVALFLVGHVTKDGALAGPRVLEHMVDCVLYFEGGSTTKYRVLRAIKNRFGTVNELGVFAMTEKGLKEVANPSAIFLANSHKQTPGSIVMATWEGSRPLLVEIQALVDTSYLGNPRRVCVGLDQNRLSMLLAVLHKHGGIVTYDQDVFINVVGGIRINETGLDLAIVAAVLSSLKNKVLPKESLIFGELGLSGEIRPVQGGVERVNEAIKHGFKTIILPKANAPKKIPSGVTLVSVTHLNEVLDCQLFQG
jgi:DNA repair protein RadA/Sms